MCFPTAANFGWQTKLSLNFVLQARAADHLSSVPEKETSAMVLLDLATSFVE
jgi:hypothetical protein